MPRKTPGVRRHGAGWQAYCRVTGVFLSESFPLDTPIGEMTQWRKDQQAAASKHPKPSRGTFAGDAARYLKHVAAMPSFQDRKADITLWIAIFGGRRRRSITSAEIRGHRDSWLLEGYAASTVNHRLRALSNLWTVLDGRRAPNPVREVPEATEPDPQPRGVPYALLRAILDALPDRGSAARHTKRPAVSKTKTRLRVQLWTGLTHHELGRLERRDWDDVAGTLFIRARGKGTGGKARVIPLSKEARTALTAFDQADAWGAFSRSSLYQSFRRACDTLLASDETPADWKVLLRDLRPYDVRHTHATTLYQASGDAHAAAEILGHRSTQTTKRYIGAAVSERVKRAIAAFATETEKAG